MGETARNNSLRSTGLEVLRQSHGDKRRGAYTNGGPGTSYITLPCFRKMQEAQIHPLVRVTSGIRNRSFFPYASGVRTSSPVYIFRTLHAVFLAGGFQNPAFDPRSLIIAGDVESNPGPSSPVMSSICNYCKRTIRGDQIATVFTCAQTAM